jgi:hypothetical protein
MRRRSRARRPGVDHATKVEDEALMKRHSNQVSRWAVLGWLGLVVAHWPVLLFFSVSFPFLFLFSVS